MSDQLDSSFPCGASLNVKASTPLPGAEEPRTLLINMSRPWVCLDDVIGSHARVVCFNELFRIAARGNGSFSGKHRYATTQQLAMASPNPLVPPVTRIRFSVNQLVLGMPFLNLVVAVSLVLLSNLDCLRSVLSDWSLSLVA